MEPDQASLTSVSTTEDYKSAVPHGYTPTAKNTEGSPPVMARSLSGCQIKSTKDPDFVYCVNYV